MHVLIFGATRNTGWEATQLLRARGDHVTAVVRPHSDAQRLTEIGADVIRADAFDAPSMRAALSGKQFDAVICSLGNTSGAPERVDHIAVANVVDVCKEIALPRFLLVSSIGAGDSRPALSPQAERFLGAVCALKTLGEDHLRASGLAFTIIRPGGLGRGPANGRGILSENPMVSGSIARAEVARLLVQCVDNAQTAGKVYSAIET